MLTLRTSILPALLACACVSPAVVGESPLDTDASGSTSTEPLGSTESSGQPEPGATDATTSSGGAPCDDSSDTGCTSEPPQSDACADVNSTLGCSFIVLAPLDPSAVHASNEGEEEEFDAVVVMNPSPDVVATILVLRMPEGLLDQELIGDPVALGPGQSVTLQVPQHFQAGSSTNLRTGGLLRVESDSPVTVSLYSPGRPFLGNDGTLLLPEEILGQEYVIPGYPPHVAATTALGGPSYLSLVALEDDTSVQWHAQFSATPGNGLPVDPVAPGEWGQIILNRFEVLRLVASDAGDLSGTVIEASGPVAVSAGSRCVTVPASTDADLHCDPVFEQLLPVERWDHRAIVPHPPLRDGERHFVRVYAGEENVRFQTDPPLFEGQHLLPTKGSYLDLEVEHGVNVVVDGDGPLMAVGYLASRTDAGGLGDPAMVQYGSFVHSRFVNHLSGLEGWDSQFVQVVRVTGEDDVRLDGDVVTGWETFGSPDKYGSFEVVTLPIGPGPHELAGAAALVTQFGWHNGVGDACAPYEPDSLCSASYAHPVGWSF